MFQLCDPCFEAVKLQKLATPTSLAKDCFALMKDRFITFWVPFTIVIVVLFALIIRIFKEKLFR